MVKRRFVQPLGTKAVEDRIIKAMAGPAKVDGAYL